jgi:AcrR family transcriptional regulator
MATTSTDRSGEQPGTRARAGAGKRVEPPPTTRSWRAERRLSRRERIASEFVSMAGVAGLHGVAIGTLCSRVGVSNRAYYQEFASKEECFALGFDLWVGSVLDRAETAFMAADGPWDERLTAGLMSIMNDMAADPLRARACCLESLHGGPLALDCFRGAVVRGRRIFGFNDLVRPAASLTSDPLDSMFAGAVLQPIHALFRADRTELLPELVPSLVKFLCAQVVQPA